MLKRDLVLTTKYILDRRPVDSTYLANGSGEVELARVVFCMGLLLSSCLLIDLVGFLPDGFHLLLQLSLLLFVSVRNRPIVQLSHLP